jgi:hypothetical protein
MSTPGTILKGILTLIIICLNNTHTSQIFENFSRILLRIFHNQRSAINVPGVESGPSDIYRWNFEHILREILNINIRIIYKKQTLIRILIIKYTFEKVLGTDNLNFSDPMSLEILSIRPSSRPLFIIITSHHYQKTNLMQIYCKILSQPEFYFTFN